VQLYISARYRSYIGNRHLYSDIEPISARYGNVCWEVENVKEPRLRKTACLSEAGGTRLNEFGIANFNITLEYITLDKEIIVAEVEDDALFGIDILQNDDGGPTDLLHT